MFTLSFRQKVFISFGGIYLLFIVLMFPFAGKTVKKIVTRAMEERTNELIIKMQSAPNNEALIRRLKERKAYIIFRVSIISDERKVLYDSHTKRLLGPKFSQEYVVEHQEVLDAFANGEGYNEEYSDLIGQKFAYFAKAFEFHGKTYVMRSAFPYKYLEEMTKDFEIGFFTLSSMVLLIYSLLSLFIIHQLSSPIQEIINAVKPYQEGENTTIPEIRLGKDPVDDFGKLAATLNSLSRKIQKHINTLTHERNEKEAVLESLIEGVISTDPSGTITYANRTAMEMLSLEYKTIVGINIHQVCNTLFTTMIAKCEEMNEPQTTNVQIKGDGGKIYLDLVAAPKKEKSGVILVLHDKSIHYKLLEMRKDFIANASHELKTPITIIRGFAETLHDNPELSEEMISTATGKILRNCHRMHNLVKDLLTLADIENLPRSRLIDCDLVAMVERCKEGVLDIYPDAKIKLIYEPMNDYHITADSHLMEHAIMNLIENGAKYSEPPSHIEVTLNNLGETVEILVTDNGIGIPEADIDHIFERFYRVDKTRSRKMGGSGLGLSIVETIIEKHFGKISISSTVGVGSTFTVVLPHNLENMV